MHIYTNKAEFDHATKVNKLLAKGGLERRAVNREEIREIEPSIQGDLYAGYYTTSDFTGDIHRYSRRLSEACENRGVIFHYHSKVRDIRHHEQGITLSYTTDESGIHRADFDGVQSRKLAHMLGDRVNIYPVKGYSITVDLGDKESQKAPLGSVFSMMRPNLFFPVWTMIGFASPAQQNSMATALIFVMIASSR